MLPFIPEKIVMHIAYSFQEHQNLLNPYYVNLQHRSLAALKSTHG